MTYHIFGMINIHLAAIFGVHNGRVLTHIHLLGNWPHFVLLCIWEGHAQIYAESFLREGLQCTAFLVALKVLQGASPNS